MENDIETGDIYSDLDLSKTRLTPLGLYDKDYTLRGCIFGSLFIGKLPSNRQKNS